jgi:monoamine oxidase
METIDNATTHFDSYSLPQAVLEQWKFNSAPLDSWTAVEGGMDRTTVGMTRTLTKKPIMNKWINGLVGSSDQTVTALISDDEKRTYSHIINTVPLGVVQNMDLSTLELELDYNKTFAIGKLQYDPAGKIGMSFKSRWYVSLYLSLTLTNIQLRWQDNFLGGQFYTDLSVRRCIYPSYGINTPEAASAMITS